MVIKKIPAENTYSFHYLIPPHPIVSICVIKSVNE